MSKFFRKISFKGIAGLVILLVLFTYAIGHIGYESFTTALTEQYITEAFNAADTADDFVDPDEIESYLNSGGETPEYKQTLNLLNRICNSFGATFIYVIIPDTSDYAHITFLFSAANWDYDYTVYDFGYVRETTNDEYKEKYRKLYDNESDREVVIRNTGYIETDPHITSMVPIRNSAGITQAILCVQRQLDVLEQTRRDYISDLLSVLIALLVLAIVGASTYFRRTLLDPIDRIAAEAGRFASENTPAENKLTDTIRSNDEIGQLAGSIDMMEEQIREYVENLTAVTAENKRIETELSLAARIQSNMLPNTFPAFPDRSDFDIFAYMTPAKEVGGDFYDFFLIDNTHLGIVIADVSGKGIPAALFMMASRIMIKNYAMTGMKPEEVLKVVNDQICSNNPEDMFVTVWLGILDLETGQLRASNAGHEYPIIKTPEGKFEILKDKHGFIIGGMKDSKYAGYDVSLSPGSILFLYTDGVTEATDKDNNFFGLESTVNALNSCADNAPAAYLRAAETAVKEFAGDAEQFDDLTMLCIEYKGR